MVDQNVLSKQHDCTFVKSIHDNNVCHHALPRYLSILLHINACIAHYLAKTFYSLTHSKINHLCTATVGMCLTYHLVMRLYDLLQAQQLHASGCDVMILVHKPNRIKRSWYTYGTSGAGDGFLKEYPKVVELWQAYIRRLTSTHICTKVL